MVAHANANLNRDDQYSPDQDLVDAGAMQSAMLLHCCSADPHGFASPMLRVRQTARPTGHSSAIVRNMTN
jgi:broad specificity phosphatase PhoE